MWNHRTRRALLVVMTLLSLAPCSVHAQPSATPALGEDEALYSCKSRTADVAVTFKAELEVKDLITWVVGFTCKSFVLDPRVVTTGRKLTLIVPTKMSATEAYRVFLVALSTVGLTIVPKGKIVQIVEAASARRNTVPLYQPGAPGNLQQVVRYLLQPSYAQPETLLLGFGAMKSDVGELQQIGTMLLITDYESHIRDMLSLARLVDVPTGSDGIYTIPVVHADAVKLADKIGGILGIGGAGAPGLTGPGSSGKAVAAPGAAVPSKVMVDDRTNTLIVASSEAGYLRFKALVERLDVALDIEGGASIHVYRLGSAIAEELAKTLNDTIGTGAGPGPQRGAAATRPGTAAPPGPAPGAAPIAALGTALEGQVRVIADTPTNALIVMSTGRDFLAIKEVIAQLDLPRRQVYIEAVILEVQIGQGGTLGTSSHGGLPISDNKALLLGGVQTPDLRSLNLGTLDAATGLIGGLVGSSLGGSKTILGKTIPSYAVLFQALADTANTNVLSAPSIIALDNGLAKYQVGTNIPYKKGLSFGGLTGDSPAGSVNTNIDRVDLLLELQIKPHISTDDTILLELKHDAKDLGEQSDLGPTWNTRSFETSVVVRDQQTVVIGGLMQERDVLTSTKVPLLGDIPILGHLFKHTRKHKRKSNLLIMLTPYIIKDQLDLAAIHERKAREHDEFVRSFKTLDRMKYVSRIDYGRKRGLVEDINRAVQSVEEDAAARQALRRPSAIPSGVIELPAP